MAKGAHGAHVRGPPSRDNCSRERGGYVLGQARRPAKMFRAVVWARVSTLINPATREDVSGMAIRTYRMAMVASEREDAPPMVTISGTALPSAHSPGSAG